MRTLYFTALMSLAPMVLLAALAWRAWLRRARYGGVAALSMAVAWAALLGSAMAEVAGAEGDPTGRFLIGMSCGLAVGLTLGCATLLWASLRVKRLELARRPDQKAAAKHESAE